MADAISLDEWHGIKVGDRVRMLFGRFSRPDTWTVVELRASCLFDGNHEGVVAVIENDAGEVHTVDAAFIGPPFESYRAP